MTDERHHRRDRDRRRAQRHRRRAHFRAAARPPSSAASSAARWRRGSAALADFLDARGEVDRPGHRAVLSRRRTRTPAKTCSSCRDTAGRSCCASCSSAASSSARGLPRPGEFTERAFLNDKLDLAQAESVADLIDAATAQAAKSALRSLQGAFSQRIEALARAVIELRALVEATLDFPDEEVDFLKQADAEGKLAAARAQAAGSAVGFAARAACCAKAYTSCWPASRTSASRAC